MDESSLFVRKHLLFWLLLKCIQLVTPSFDLQGKRSVIVPVGLTAEHKDLLIDSCANMDVCVQLCDKEYGLLFITAHRRAPDLVSDVLVFY